MSKLANINCMRSSDGTDKVLELSPSQRQRPLTSICCIRGGSDRPIFYPKPVFGMLRSPICEIAMLILTPSGLNMQEVVHTNWLVVLSKITSSSIKRTLFLLWTVADDLCYQDQCCISYSGADASHKLLNSNQLECMKNQHPGE